MHSARDGNGQPILAAASIRLIICTSLVHPPDVGAFANLGTTKATSRYNEAPRFAASPARSGEGVASRRSGPVERGGGLRKGREKRWALTQGGGCSKSMAAALRPGMSTAQRYETQEPTGSFAQKREPPDHVKSKAVPREARSCEAAIGPAGRSREAAGSEPRCLPTRRRGRSRPGRWSRRTRARCAPCPQARPRRRTSPRQTPA